MGVLASECAHDTTNRENCRTSDCEPIIRTSEPNAQHQLAADVGAFHHPLGGGGFLERQGAIHHGFELAACDEFEPLHWAVAVSLGAIARPQQAQSAARKPV